LGTPLDNFGLVTQAPPEALPAIHRRLPLRWPAPAVLPLEQVIRAAVKDELRSVVDLPPT
jgi:hypothetical protein